MAQRGSGLFGRKNTKRELKVIVFDMTMTLRELSVNLEQYREAWLSAGDSDPDESFRELVQQVAKLNECVNSIDEE